MKKYQLRKNICRTITLILALICLFSAMCVTGYAATTEVLPDGTYVLYTYSVTTCLNVQFEKQDGGKVCVDHADLQANELWILKNVDRGYVTLSPKHAPNCYLSGEMGFDKQLVIRRCVPSEAIYQWLPIQVGEGEYVFKNRANGYVIDCAHGMNTTIGNPFLLFERNNFASAQTIHPVRISTSTNLAPGVRVINFASGYYKVGLYANKNQVLNSQYGVSERARIVCDPYNGEANEILSIQAEGNGLYSLRFAGNTSLCIAPPDVFVDSQLTVRRYDGSRSCLWEIYQVGSTYCFRNAATGLMMDDFCCQSATGTKIISFSYNQCTAQQFYLTRVSVNSSASSSSGPAVKLNVPNYKQYDGRWANVKIGSKTIKSIGCLLTCSSMIYSYKTGTEVYPNAMKSKLSFSNNDLVWSSLTRYGFTLETSNSKISNSMLSRIYTQLKADKPVIIGGRSSSGGTHFVVVTGYNGTSTTSFNASNFTINDPNSSSRTTLAAFLAAYPTVTRMVY